MIYTQYFVTSFYPECKTDTQCKIKQIELIVNEIIGYEKKLMNWREFYKYTPLTCEQKNIVKDIVRMEKEMKQELLLELNKLKTCF